MRPLLLTSLFALSPVVFVLACGSSSGFDSNSDRIADDLGDTVDLNGDNIADDIDLNGDGTPDGVGIDTNGDGVADAVGLDTDCDGWYDAIDTTGDGVADFVTRLAPPPTVTTGCGTDGGTGGTVGTGTGGAPINGSGGVTASGGAATGGGPPVDSQLGLGQYSGTGNSAERYATGDVYRNGTGYKFIANGWGSGWSSHSVSWNGTSFNVASLTGSQGGDYSPAGYPTVFCGQYSNPPIQSAGTCGLPAAISSLTTVKTGWRWTANGNGQYNAAWDIWLGNGGSLSSYLMVWLRDPPGQQPAGSAAGANITVANVPGTWTVWTGNVNGIPIVNYIKPEGQDIYELEFDVMDFYRDANSRGYSLPGSQILSVAVGFEVWNGPVTNIASNDFYVDVN